MGNSYRRQKKNTFRYPVGKYPNTAVPFCHLHLPYIETGLEPLAPARVQISMQ